MYYSEDIIEEVRNRNDIVGVISQYVNLKKKGTRYVGLCPFHNEKTGSFSVSQDKQMYYCFGCHVGGNVFSFVMDYENLDFKEALEQLADRAGMELPKQEQSAAQKKEANRKAQMMEVYRETAIYYYKQLRGPLGARAKAYFDGRGLSVETQKKFGLGYAPQSPAPLYKYLKDKGYSDELIKDAGILKIDERGAWDRFYNRAMFPIMDARSRVIGFGGRVMGEGEPKYLNSAESPIFDKSRNLYGLFLAKSSRRPYMLLCEGYMDVISLHQAGFDCAVASLGTAFTSGHASLIKRYVNEVILTFDSDGAGQNAIKRAIPILKSAGLTVKTLDMRPYKDPDEFIKYLGAEAYEERIAKATNAFFFESDIMYREHDMLDPESKTAFHRKLAAKLAEFTDTLERENYLAAVSERYSIPATALRELVNYIGGSKVKSEDDITDELVDAPYKRREKGRGITEAERMVLSFVATLDKPYYEITKYVRPEYFTNEINAKVAAEVFKQKELNAEFSPAAFIDRFSEDTEERDQIARIFSVMLPDDETEAKAILTNNIKLIKREYIKRQLQSERDTAKLQQLIKEMAELDKYPVDIV